MLVTNAAANWFFDRNFIKKTNNMIEYRKIKTCERKSAEI